MGRWGGHPESSQGYLLTVYIQSGVFPFGPLTNERSPSHMKQNFTRNKEWFLGWLETFVHSYSLILKGQVLSPRDFVKK